MHHRDTQRQLFPHIQNAALQIPTTYARHRWCLDLTPHLVSYIFGPTRPTQYRNRPNYRLPQSRNWVFKPLVYIFFALWTSLKLSCNLYTKTDVNTSSVLMFPLTLRTEPSHLSLVRMQITGVQSCCLFL